jgi:hypothetical protein
MSFFLVRLEPDGNGGMSDVPIPDHGPYEKGSEAAKFAKVLTNTLGFKVQPRRISQAPDWRERQAKRLQDGTLKKLPEKWDLPQITDHFAHIDAKDPSKIAFTENDELGKIDRVTAVTPGRYITRFYNDIQDSHRRKLIAAIDPNGEIFFAWTRDEIATVYIDGPSSCMDGAHSFDDMDDIWPTEPYAGGDLAVAYTKNARGKIQSRCLCWPEKKLFGRCYGDIERMIAAMMAEGYEYIHGNEVSFPTGAKILKIPHPHKKHHFIMPYFDDVGMVADKGDHFETWNGASNIPNMKYIACGGASGYSLLYRICPRLKSGAPDHEFQFVHGVNEEWCRAAYDGYAFLCTATGKRYPTEHMVRMATPGVLWSRDHFEEHGTNCSITRKNHPRSEMLKLGDRLVHSSVSHRFNDKGEELAIERPKRDPSRTAWANDLSLREYIDYDRGSRRPTQIMWARDLIINRLEDTILDDPFAEVTTITNAA